jgi:hypothetical protein
MSQFGPCRLQQTVHTVRLIPTAKNNVGTIVDMQFHYLDGITFQYTFTSSMIRMAPNGNDPQFVNYIDGCVVDLTELSAAINMYYDDMNNTTSSKPVVLQWRNTSKIISWSLSLYVFGIFLQSTTYLCKSASHVQLRWLCSLVWQHRPRPSPKSAGILLVARSL